jgi:hypothetical protein
MGNNMALINCGECGKKHSENAEICPSCGNPNSSRIAQKGFAGLAFFWDGFGFYRRLF